MNHVYRIIWNTVSHTWVVASEFAKGRKKAGKSSRTAPLRGVVLALSLFGGAAAHAGTISTPVQAQNGTYSGTSTTAASATGEDSVAAGAAATASAQGTTAVGAAAKATAQNSTAVGILSNASGNASVALGWQAVGSGTYAVAIGGNANAAGTNSMALGAQASTAVDAKNALAFGTLANASAVDALAIGDRASATQTSAVALGANASATAANSVALGSGSTTTANLGAAAYNPGNAALAGTTPAGEVSLGSSGNERRVTNVAAGAAATDAVNVSQLTSEANKSNALGAATAAALGGGSAYDASTGNLSAPSYTVAGAARNSVGAALTALDSASVQFNGTGGAADVKGNKVVNVANGAVNATSTDAVNGSQLHATNQLVAGNATNIANNTTAITSLGDTVNAINSKGTKYFHANSSSADSVASGSESVAIGPNAVASGAYSVAQGAGAKASGAHSVAMGDYSTASKDFAVAMGQNAQANGQQATALGQGATVTADNSTAVGTSAQATGIRSIAAGSFSTASGQNSTAMGDFANAKGGLSTALGNASNATGDYATALGNGATAGAQFATALGNASSVSGMGGVAIGSGASASQDNSVAIGRRSTTQADLSLEAYKPNASASIAGQAPIGEFSVGAQGMERRVTNVAAGASDTDAVNVSQLKASVATSTADSVLYDAGSSHSRVTLGGATYNGVTGAGGTTLSNVAQGALNAASSEAVNGSQLYSTNQNVAQNTTNIANNSTKIANIDGRVTTVEGSVSNITNQINNGSVGLVQQSAAGANLTVGNGIDGAAVDFADKDGKTRTLKQVTAGVDDTDAVNVSQLKASGLVDANGNALNAVTYDNAAKDSVTLGGVGATSPVKLKNVADGSDDTDAVNVRQLKSSGLVDNSGNTRDAVTYDAGYQRGVVTFGGGANGTLLTNVRDGAIAAGSRDAVNGGQISSLRDNLQNQISGLNNQVTNIDNRVTHIEANGAGTGTGGGGSLPYVDGNANGSSGNHANAGSTAGVAVGYNANATGANASVVGQNATALGSYGTAVGNDSYAAGANDTALGGNAKVHADGSVAVGANATVTSAAATNAVAVGADTQVSAASGTAVGQGASVTSAATGSVALGQGAVADRANTVSVGTAGSERQVVNVAAGKQATDAVNVSQLQASQAGTVRYDSNADGSVNNASITMNAGGAPTAIHNVAAGAATSDAVNVGQLNQGLSDAKDWAKSYTDQQVNQVNNRANAGVASAMAMSNLPQAYQPNQSSAGVALGSFRGEQSMAVGMSTISESGRYIFKASATSNTRGDMGVGVGAGMVW